jgi:predicted NAD/FAD-binding protein
VSLTRATVFSFFWSQGLGLSVDDNFAVVDECFPYIARRMLSDDSPRMREALRTFIYDSNNRLNVERLEVRGDH